ncbi:fungal-specific transcription factor domain-containing protein [Penicillium macrosclerotiorum]|uniref:fungal-specific transcription factor domain-containing protein n=1 Tax=Penicillium macrosclerotiorum TaxID=303699 RepID=UPI0025466FF6|nr:fungal-specific transcription factor domain-containing protein [Penicillium macrosclerotiorum]KAJ5689797.1 fungal-specific transcription factor domain-containing protein [Penicillium macrosclerotiorum]
MLIFQQDDFRQNWQQLYDSPREYITNNYSNPGFISLFLVVVAIAFQYTGTHRRQLLQTYHIDKISFKDEILSKIRDKILDIVSWGSLEAVQTCVLLGTYYLYHGNPGLAWPVCGCALRIAQAMNLHRRLSNREQISPRLHRQNETRKRCWWAIYEIETFCSMAYGYPHGIRDADCDVDLIDPLAKSMNGQSPASFDATHQCPASLLSYKYLMSRLSVLIKDILTDLYGIGSYRRATERDRSDSSSTLQNLVRQVKLLDARLRQWKAKIPAPLNIDNSEASVPKYRSTEEMDRDIGASGPDFEAHIYQLQAFSLELAYQNARILAHRPLLTYKIIPRAEGDLQSSGESCAPNSFHTSLQACRDAALKTSEMGTKSIFPLAVDTYAASFIGIHTFTAGVLLCILISIEPLSPQSYQSKMGLRRLLNMQVHLKSRSKSTLAVQGVEIMERLTKLVMEKELKEMLTSPGTGGPLLAPNPHNDLHEDPRDDIEPDSQILASSLPEVSLNEESIFDYIEDPAMSQALSDFDQGMLYERLEKLCSNCCH